MQSQVKKASVDVFVDGGKTRSGWSGFPDPEELARKYALDGGEGKDGRDDESGSKSMGEAQFLQQLEFAQKQQALMQKVEAKNMEVERLCTLLEALEPVPGMDAARYKRLLENPDSEHVDFRDSKIVALAKKVRKLQLALNKERALSEAQTQNLDDFKVTNDKLRKEIDSLAAASSSSATSATRTIRAPASSSDSPSKGPGQVVVDPAELEMLNSQLRKDLAASNRTVEELRRKVAKATDEAKSLSQALAREVGDGVTLEQAVDGGWRGRAQQIIMLKSKIKRLEAAAGLNATAATVGTHTSLASRQTRGVDVDLQAESGLAEMSNERRIAVDAIVEERARLIDDFTKLEAKSQGQKARIRKMEEESQTHRQQLKIVLDKSETDDQLISALRREIARLQQQTSVSARKDEARMDVAVRQAGALASTAAEAEIARLKRQVLSQRQQLETQDARIRELTMRR